MSSKTSNGDAIVAPLPLPQPDADPCTWPTPARPIAPSASEVHVWCATPAALSQHLSSFHSLISVAERDRADKFRFAADREGYIIRHGILRIILSRYLELEPTRIEFVHGYAGKPALKADRVPLFFNDSHSRELALFAFTGGCPIGVDIECVRPIPEFESIASHYFSPREVQRMRTLSSDKKMTAFYSCWTGKEAYLKATGEGIGKSLDKVEITLDEDLRAIALHVPGNPQSPSEWKVRAFSPAPGYLAAIALHGEISAVNCWRFPASW
jgi:4'-phosphopantetheinyl transferase